MSEKEEKEPDPMEVIDLLGGIIFLTRSKFPADTLRMMSPKDRENWRRNHGKV